MAAGSVNAIAGGGSLISFPALIAFGVPPNLPNAQKIANATNNAALLPGSIGSVFGFLDEIKEQRGLFLALALPSAIGGLLGAVLLANTPEAVFKRLVPFLVLFATLLFAGSSRITRFFRHRDGSERIGLVGGIWGILFQLVIATYGGYFGAGQSIMMMGSLSIMGLTDIHRINGLKTALAVVINGIAFIFFALSGLILWNLAVVMGVGAVIGGYGAARVSKRVDQRLLRQLVILIGFAVSAWLFISSR